MKNVKQASPAKSGWMAVGFIAIVLALLFWRSFLPDYVFFSNDGPLGQQNAAWQEMPGGMTGMWLDLNYLGSNAGAATPGVSFLLHTLLQPLGYAKFYAPISLFILGLGAWTLFRQFKLSPLAAILGALAAMLNSTFFSTACWGVASQEIAAGMNFFALALVIGCTSTTPTPVRLARLALAGLCVGMNVMEAADIGALYSILVAIFVFYYSLIEAEGAPLQKVIRGISRVAVVAVFAGFIAFQAVASLIGIGIHGVTGTAQDTETKAAHWDWATQWSLPKTETFGLLVPGLFGYKMDTPKDMQPSLTNSYNSGIYWGGMGRDPNIDRWLDAGMPGPQPQGFMRFTGGGNYCGILVLLLAGWTIAQSLRRQNSVFPDVQRRIIQFWAAVMLLCLLFAWGRFATFYALLYQLPYFSTIRNPAKFLNFFSWALVIVFAYGVHALNRRYLDAAVNKSADLSAQLKNWWAKVSSFDRKWTYATLGLFGASVVGWVIYSSQKTDLVSYLHKVGIGGSDPTIENSAAAVIAFSIGQAAWFLVLFAIAVGLMLLVISGYFNGPRAKTGMVLLGAFLLFDLGRANLPWLVDWDYKQKYEVGSLNPIIQKLLDKPYEHRVAGLPFRTPEGLELFDELYRIEWMQHHFPYYNIQSLDIVQMPRMPEDMKAYKETLAPRGDLATAPMIAREWQLTDTRYLLGPAGYIEVMNQQLDPVQHRFRIVQRFEVVPKPGIARPTRLEEMTAMPSENGNFALFEFTGALPRAKVYSNWETNSLQALHNFTTNGLDATDLDVFQLAGTNEFLTLKKLASPSFDPQQTVLVSQAVPAPTSTGATDGNVEYKSYHTKNIVLSATTTVPSVLLLNDKFDSDWTVTVDGQPAELLRCNFMMRGVYLPTPGQHTVDFSFHMPSKPFYVTLAGIAVAVGLCGFLAFASWKRQTVRP